MVTRRRVGPTPWSHEGLEQRGYKKCPYCWRHLVKIEEHVAGHREGRIGPDGKRRDRSPEEQRRWTERSNGSPATERFREIRRTLVPRARYERILRLPPVDLARFREQVDAAVDQEP